MKFLILIFCFFIIQLNAYSLNAESYCPQPPYNLSSDTISAVAKYSGVNFVTKQITEKLISKVLREELNTSFDVNLVPFSNNSLLNGKFQSLSVFGNNATKKGLYFSTISAQTLCGYNQIKYQDNELYLLENSVIKFSARMTENDLNKILNANEYTSFLKNFKLKANNYIFAEISNIQAKIQNDKLIFKIDTLLPSIFGITPQTFDITTGLNVENGKINLSNIKTKNSLLNLLLQNSEPLLDKINPFVYKMQTKEKYDIILNVENVKIENNEIFIIGTIVILKNY